jgi:glutathione S-transferase
VLTLWGHPFSSYTWKALIALYANATEFERVDFEPGNAEHAAALGRFHPLGKFPVLLDDGREIIESTAIIEYLAVHHPGPAPLIPSDPDAAITARMLDRVFDNAVMTPMNRVVSAHIAQPEAPDAGVIDAAKAELRRAYRWLETWLGEHALPPHVSLVTCAAAPSLFYADWVEPIGPEHPRLSALRAELLALPDVARCVEDARPFRQWFPPGAPDRD